MKILRVAQEIYPDVVGGGAYHAHALSRDQAANGHEVTVLTISPDIRDRQWETRDGYKVVRCPSTHNFLGNEFSVSALQFLRTHIDEFDIVHGHAHFYMATNVAAFLARSNEIPFAITNHSLISQSVPQWIAKLHLRTLGRYTFNSADVIFCYTEHERRELRNLCDSVDIQVVSNGIDRHRFSPDGPSSSVIPENDGQTVLFVGRLVEGKCPRDAIDAYHEVTDEFEDAQLCICGDGPLREELEAHVAELESSDSIHFHGLVDYDEMPAVFRSADVLVLPSRSEGFPRTLMEAFSTQTPVIASDLEQTSGLVSKAGRVAPVEDVDSIAEHLRELLGDSELREQLGRNGRQLIKEEGLSWESSVEETTAVLERLVNQSERSRTERESRMGVEDSFEFSS
ncbi:glycosyltransferase family 4 protein [Salinigranum halophilum]|uniref:glycosyltransferase family 4 protein n=1 Tax=Salinigranum halophilum TaxID=2565931 RepID=UPI0010A8E599|nr:glycosyltransferase family 4 protein [Salinigranum halophilum]